MSKRPKLTMRGAMGIDLASLKPEQVEWLKTRLTLTPTTFKENETPDPVRCYHESDGYLWMPRYFKKMDYWDKIPKKEWHWVAPKLDYTLAQLMTPLPERKQPEAIDALEAALRRDSATIGVLPTGLGKTMIALSVARRFQTPIAVFIYAGHMIDNWVEHAQSVLGIPPEDIGLVKEGRCDIGKPLTIVSIQTALSRNLPQEFYNQIGFIIADECLSGDTLITTNVGDIRIDEIPRSGATSVLCYDENVEQWAWRGIKRWIPQGKKQTIVVTTSAGTSIRVTKNHPIMTSKGWKPAGELETGDRILSPVRASAEHSYHRSEAEDDRSVTLGGTAHGVLGSIGMSASGCLMRRPQNVRAAVVSNSASERTWQGGASKTTNGPDSYQGTTPPQSSVPRCPRAHLALSTAPSSAIRVLRETKEVGQTQESFSITAPPSTTGRLTKQPGSMVLRSNSERSTIQGTETSFIGQQASVTHHSDQFTSVLDHQKESPKSGLTISLTKVGHGGTWTMDPANVAVSDFTRKDLTKSPSGCSQIICQTDGVLTQQSERPRVNTGSSGFGCQMQSSGSGSQENTQHQEWNTSFQTITKIEDGPPLGESVYDLEIDEHHNFVANGLLVHNCHRYGARLWGSVTAKFPARYRLGMSASPVRDDGLDPIIRWNFGKVGHCVTKRPTGRVPLVCMIRIPTVQWEVKEKGKPARKITGGEYPERKYMDWKKKWIGGRHKWVPDKANFQKYSKFLAKDEIRNAWLVGKMIEARAKGRCTLVFAHHRDHIKALHDEFVERWAKSPHSRKAELANTTTGLLWGGLKKKERERVSGADLIFTTHSYAREALNLTHLDTLIFATPPGDPLQPAGRLRDKGPEDRKDPLIIDPFENGDYPFRKAMRRKQDYESLGMTVRRMSAKR